MAHAAAAPSGRNASLWDFYCFNCDGGGHHAYMCPSPRRDGRPQPQQQQQQQQQPPPPFSAAAAPPSGQSQRPFIRPPFRPSGGKGGRGYGRGQRQPPDRRAMAQAALADMQWQPAEDGNFYGSDGYSYQEHLSYLLNDMDQSFSNMALDQGDIPVGNPQNESGFSTHLTVDDQESAFWDRWQDKASGRSA